MKAFEIVDRRSMEVEDRCSDEMPRKKLCKETNKIDRHHDINPGSCREGFLFWKHLLPKFLPFCLLPNRVCSLSNPGPSFLTPITIASNSSGWCCSGSSNAPSLYYSLIPTFNIYYSLLIVYVLQPVLSPSSFYL